MLTKRIGVIDILLYIALFLLSLSILYPFFNILILSFNETQLAAGGRMNLWPSSPTFENYRRVFQSPFVWRGYLNTIIRTVFGTVAQLFATSLGAYVLAKRFFPHRTFWTFFIVFTMFFNGGLIPT